MNVSKTILSLVKASKILELIMSESRALGVSELSRALDMPKPTVQNMLFTLESEGLLEKDPMSLKYRLGARLFQLGMHYANNMDLTMIARAWLERLCSQYGETSRAGIVMGEKIIIVMEVQHDSSYMTFPGPGSVIPPHTTSIGKILLAYMPDKRREKILGSIQFTPLTDKTLKNMDELKSELAGVHSEGIAFDNEESLKGLSCIAGPVFNHRNECIAAISLSGNSAKMELRRNEIINAIKYTCFRMSEQMGYRGEQPSVFN